MINRLNWRDRVRAFCLMLVLLIGPQSALTPLFANSDEECSMEMCIEQGRCCCTPRLALVKGQHFDGQNIKANELWSECPNRCCTEKTSSRLFRLDAEGESKHTPIIFAATLVASGHGHGLYDATALSSFSARAPPSVSTAPHA